MRHLARAILVLAFAGTASIGAMAQQPQRSGAGDLDPSVDPDPLRFGTDEAFLSIQPFFQFEAGAASSAPDALLDTVDHVDGQMRRARLYFDFGFHQFGGRFAADVGGPTPPEITYAYLNYNFSNQFALQVGHQEQQFSMEELIGSRSALFNENGVNATLVPSAAVGAATFYGQENFSLGLGVYGTDINNEKPLGEGTTVAGRATFAPINDEDTAIHFGAALAGTFDPQIPLAFAGSNGTELFEASPVETGEFEAVDTYLAANLEFAAAIGRFTIQSEYTLGKVRDDIRRDAFLHGGYFGVLAFLTNDRRSYDGQYGTFERVSPEAPVEENTSGFGAVEIGARLDYLNLSEASDADEDSAGTQIAGTAIANWYLTDQLRISASNTYTAVIEGTGDGDDYNTAILRFWFMY
ncbi:OprO/OprP family phosphate-selective porin [Aureimonas psammosilenae]|uniref:OprO/OprP family phosphate-selective porin n=1 Tax=Aureimonas psammosilenae TaxID=2495496 RepID=UPI0012606BCD|nr:porin [Aureimonas psammosilenae]